MGRRSASTQRDQECESGEWFHFDWYGVVGERVTEDGLGLDRAQLRVYIPRPPGWVAQLVEQRTENPRVGGSIPSPAIRRTPPRDSCFGAFRFLTGCLAGAEVQ